MELSWTGGYQNLNGKWVWSVEIGALGQPNERGENRILINPDWGYQMADYPATHILKPFCESGILIDRFLPAQVILPELEVEIIWRYYLCVHNM